MVNHSEATDLATIPPLLHCRSTPARLELSCILHLLPDHRLYSHCQRSLSFYRVINRQTYTPKMRMNTQCSHSDTRLTHTHTHTRQSCLVPQHQNILFSQSYKYKQKKALNVFGTCVWMVHKRGQLYQFISIPGTLQTTLLHSQIM